MNAWSWLETLGRASVEGGLLILAVWAVCRLWPRMPAWARGSLWWMACARLLIALLPLTSIAVRAPMPVTAVWWPSALASTPASDPRSQTTSPGLLGEPVTRGPASAGAPEAAAGTQPPLRGLDPRWWPLLLVGVWSLGAATRSIGLARQCWRVRRLVRGARPLAQLESERIAPGVSAALAVSDEAPVPMVTGLFRPIILLPEAMLVRSEEDLRLATAHEVSHLRRGDLWLAWVPALAETLFWFHPLVPRCAREYVQACEEACDQDALRATGANPYDYGRLLVAFGVHRPLAVATAMPCGSPNPGQLKRRLSMLRPFSPLHPRLRNLTLGLVTSFALVAFVPLRLVPTAASPTSAVVDRGALAAADAVAASSADAKATTSGAHVDVSSSSDPGDGANTQADHDADVATPPKAPKASSTGYAYGFDGSGKDHFAYVLVDGAKHNYSGSGESADWSEVRRLDKKLGHDFLWTRIGDDRYLIEDPNLLAKVREAFRPQTEIGEQQGRLGSIQAEIGDQQSAIGDQQAKVGEKQSEVGQRQSELAEEMSRQSGHRRSSDELERLANDLSAQMEALGREQERLSRRMEPLSRQQEDLGAQMEALSRNMARVSERATREVRSLIDRAIRDGVAKPLR